MCLDPDLASCLDDSEVGRSLGPRIWIERLEVSVDIIVFIRKLACSGFGDRLGGQVRGTGYMDVVKVPAVSCLAASEAFDQSYC